MALILSVISGFFLNLAFAPFNFWPAAFVSLGALFLVLSNRGFWKRMLIAFIFALSFFLLLLHWSGSYVGWFPWISLALLQAGIFALIGLIRFERDFLGAIGFAGWFLLIELLRMKMPFGGFGWGRIGHTQTYSLSSLYPIIGIAGISFLVVLVSVLFSLRKWKALSLLALVASISFIMPAHLRETGKINVLAVQGGVDQLGLEFNQRALSVLRRHIAATNPKTSNLDLVVWPENASDLDPEKNPIAKKEISDLLVRINKPILVGAVERSNAGPLNVSILYNPDGNKIKYVKQDLAPFGEYIPLRSLAERIEPTAKRVVDFQPGREPVVFQIEKSTFATLICFEILDDDLVRRSTRGASFLINQTNNATFGKSNQAAQQLQIASARAAELQKSLVAVSTTGFTSYIDSSGRSIATLPQFQPGSLSADVVTNEGRSLASSLGSLFWFGFGALALGLRRLRYLDR